MAEALMMSGGIGDFIHYIACFDAFRARHRTVSTVWVESSDPASVRRLFELTLPEVDVRFCPPAMHWTRACPLVSAVDPADHALRPARRHVEGEGWSVVQDWFTPLQCRGLSRSSARLESVAASTTEDFEVLVSVRDKGAGWWPDLELVAHHLPSGVQMVAIGSVGELSDCNFDGVEGRVAGDAAEALAWSARARHYVGTDTGLATIREYLHRVNVYCLAPGWKDAWMQRFDYWPISGVESQSIFCEDRVTLSRALGALDCRVPRVLR